MRLENKVAVVTGGAQGIGQAVVRKFVAEGARIALLDIDEPRGQAEAERHGDAVRFIRCDITREADVAAAIAGTIEAFGTIDILVNNAGVNTYFDATTMTEDEWEKVFAVDLKGAWLCCKHALPHMREQGSGAIVNIASIHAFMTTYNQFPYAAAKSGMVGMTRSLALDFGKHQIRVNAICPGWVRTQLVDARPARRHAPGDRPRAPRTGACDPLDRNHRTRVMKGTEVPCRDLVVRRSRGNDQRPSDDATGICRARWGQDRLCESDPV